MKNGYNGKKLNYKMIIIQLELGTQLIYSIFRHATVYINNKIYIFGGIDENDRQNDILEYNVLNNDWNRLKV